MTGIEEQVELKSLQSRLQREKAEVRVLERDKEEMCRRVKAQHRKVSDIQNQITSLTKDHLILSEHARLRFLERVELIDTSKIEELVITEALKKVWKVLGNGEYPIGIGEHTCVIRNGIITTIK